ncbi:hypothetical protein BJ322DRAFT_892176 [Thelephora terrestris]|uniref:Uncharacterized protein n=1 Tax=Thelephora terrestris TaxID=56493 RepID=A0A9P6HCE3_9AGAM|nr:hypothetical protein BJ322DRAFT_892176 [Thelephora terrestris]
MSLFRKLKQAALGVGRPKLHGKAQLSLHDVPFYELDPLPWWSKKGWTYFFVTADAMITISLADMLWNRWTRAEQVTIESKTASPGQTQHVLRPLWQRVAAVAGLGFASSYLAFMLVIGRSRIIQRAWIIPAAANASISSAPGNTASSTGRQIFFQCVHHRKSQGQLYPYRDCKLHGLAVTTSTKEEREVLMKVDGLRGFYSMSLEGAKINGESVCGGKDGSGLRWARRRLFDAWAVGGGSKPKFRPNFTSGPASLN